jgi:chaperonin cofactor prefoldin
MKNPTKDMLKEMLEEADLTIESLRAQVRILESQVEALSVKSVEKVNV